MAQATRVPPHNLEAEANLLGAMLLARQAVDEAAATNLAADDFYAPAHGHIYDALVDLAAKGQPVDAVTAADHLERRGLLESVGGRVAIAELAAGATTIGNAHRYADIVTDLARQRRLIAIGGEITESGYQPTTDVDELVDRAEQLLFDLTDNHRAVHTYPAADAIHGWLDRLTALYTDGRPAGTLTGFIDLDAIILGLQPGQLVVAAGRPGMGKTSLGTDIARNAAHDGHPVLLVSIEMSHDEVTSRIVSAGAKVPLEAIRSGKISDRDWDRIHHATGELGGLPLDIHDEANVTIAGIRAAARRTASRYGRIDLIVVDYVQLMRSTGRHQNREAEVAEVARGLKLLARDLHVPVLALAQLNRGLENRADKRPMLSDLRESGEIENAADVVLMLYRDDYYNPESKDRGTAELIVAKQRNGPVGTSRLAWLNQYATFANMARV